MRDQGIGFRYKNVGLEYRVCNLGDKGLGFTIRNLGLRVKGCRTWGLRFGA
jgi:hypothetical protein